MSPGSLRVGVLGDVHLTGDTSETAAWHNAYDFGGLAERLTLAVAAFEAARIDLVCLIGDLTHHGEGTELAPLASALGDVDAPVLGVAGNHDAGGYPPLAEVLSTAQAASPEGQSVNGWRVAGVQVAAGGWFGARAVDAPITEAWGSEPVLLLSHFPLLSHAERLAARGMPYPGDLLDRDTIAEALQARSGPTVVMSGHIHARDSSRRDGVLQLVQAALIEAPYECSVLELSPTSVTRRAVALDGPEPDGVSPTLVPDREHFSFADGAWQPTAPLPTLQPTAPREPS